MSGFIRSITLGQAKVTIINIGDIYLPLISNMNIPETELAARDDLLGLIEQRTVPIHCIHIQLPQTSVLVDAGVYDIKPDSEYAIPNYHPPPLLWLTN